MFKSYLTLIIIVLFSACAGTKTTVTETKTKVDVVTEITTKKIDTTIFTPAESVGLFIPIAAIDIQKNEAPKEFYKKEGRVSTTVLIDSLGIKVTSNCDSIASRITYYEQVFKQQTQEISELKTKVEEKKGYSLTELILYMIATGVVCFAAAYLLKTVNII